MPRGVRPLLTLVFFAAAAYCFLKLWLAPQAGQLHPALAVAAGVLILLVALVLAGAIARRRRRRGDEKSTLRL
jgi:ABC-type branched-subunit amino acid transport system permease subunit